MKPGGRSASSAHLPALSSLRGHVSGEFTAIGGESGASCVTFKGAGCKWRWGRYMMDNMAVSGVLDSTTGLHMEQLQVDAEGAKLSMQVCPILCLLLRCYKNVRSAETIALIPEMLAVFTKFVCRNAAGSVVETL